MQNERLLTYVEAINEGTRQLLESDPNVVILGEGVSDPKAIFGTTKDLAEEFPGRVFDTPVSEGAISGIALGLALQSFRPILIHQRIDFALYSVDQIINNIAKWYSMFGGQGGSASLVIRAIIGQGWGQGNQHSQNLAALFAHVPGLKVVMPSNAYNGKGLLAAAVGDNNPVLFLEHRWIYGVKSYVPSDLYEVSLDRIDAVWDPSADIAIVSWSHWFNECQIATDFLRAQGIKIGLLNLHALNPLNRVSLLGQLFSARKILIVDGAWKSGGFAAEIVATLHEDDPSREVHRLSFPDFPTPSSPGLAQHYYPTAKTIFDKVVGVLDKKQVDSTEIESHMKKRRPDAPDNTFVGPF